MANTTDGIFGTTLRFPTTDQAWKAAIDTRSERILTSHKFLASILDQYEDTIYKRWNKKSLDQRARLLRASYDGEIPATHREDFQHYLWTCVNRDKPDPTLYHLFLCPQINVEDLSRPTILPLLLDARARHHPMKFLESDDENMSCGVKLRLIPSVRSITSEPHWVYFKRAEQPAEFARFAHQNEKLRSPPDTLVHDAPKALLILEAQTRIMTLLVNGIRNILHDVDVDQLRLHPSRFAGSSSANKSTKAVDGSWAESASDSGHDFESVDIFGPEAIYRVPVPAVMSSLQTLLYHWASEKRSDFLSLREDPGYYQARMTEAITDTSKAMSDLDRSANARVISEELALAAEALHDWTRMASSCAEFTTLNEYLGDLFKCDNKVDEPASGPCAAACHDMQLRAYAIATGRLKHIIMMVPLRDLTGTRLDEGNKSRSSCKLINIMRNDSKHATALLGQFAAFMQEELRTSSFCNLVLLGEIQYFMRYGPGKDLLNSSRLVTMVSDIFLASLCCSLPQLAGYGMLHTCPSYSHLRESTSSAQKKVERDGELLHCILHVLEPTIEQHGLLAGRRFDYPCTQRATPKHITTLQRSEKNLETLWTAIDAVLVKLDKERELDILWNVLDAPRQGYKTPDWQPDVLLGRAVESKPASGIQTDTLDLAFRTQGCVEDNHFKKSKKAKLALEQEAAPSAQQVEKRIEELDSQLEPVHSTPTPVLVDEGTLRVLHTLFFVPGANGQRGEIPWKDFLHAMDDMDFEGRKLLGSAWAFSRDKDECLRRIHVHQPHPSNKIRFEIARDWGRRLRDAYGWTIDTFQVVSKAERGRNDSKVK
ncbi:hypothetical protein AMS68_000042 [Peltaster fructicola]|uniref:Clr5 domain-containing protein n=1 Tax=Peltaster fructicola TaxID=286661 RepID=A0A6H0XIS1_9PEZI|nr:hypothetical protein AMS68_000042 [Peltaster fructicola]